MLDVAGILFSCIMMLMVIVRAVQLDRTQPWFQAVKPLEGAKTEKPGTWKRGR
jgi:hypothetical protein